MSAQKVSPIEFKENYSQVSVYRIAVFMFSMEIFGIVKRPFIRVGLGQEAFNTVRTYHIGNPH